jgi:hypothetical protein
VRRALILIWIASLSGSLSACDAREWFVCALGACGVTLDTRPPFPPQSPRAVAFSRGVALDWTASAASDVAKYDVYRSTVSGGSRRVVGSTTSTSFRDTGLTNGTKYFYAIRAVDALDRGSTFSREVSATPQAGLAPAAPAGLTATEGEGFIDLMWAESFSAVSYHVWRATTSGGPYTELAATAATTYRDSAAQSGTRYFYAVSAENAEGSVSALTAEVAATPGGGLSLVTSWGGFDGLVDVAVDRFNNVWALEDFPGWSVKRFTANGTFVSGWDIVGEYRGIGTDSAGNVYLTNAQFDVVEKYSPAGTLLISFGGGRLTDPYDVAIDDELGVLVTDEGGDRVEIFSPGGGSEGTLAMGPLDAPRGIAADRATVYVVDSGNDRVRRFRGGQVTTIGGPGTQNGEFRDPRGVAASGAGIWVTDTDADRVQAFTLAGAWRTWFGVGLDRPYGIAADCTGNVYVADRGNERIEKFSSGVSAPCASFAGAFASRAFRGSFVATKSVQGKVSGFTEKRARQQGTFNVRGVGKGRWYALFDATGDPLKLTARATGKLLALRKGRDACLSFRIDVKDGVVTGRFSGGARGTFRQTLAKTWKVTGSGTPGPASLTACRTVRKAFRLR